MSGISPLVLTKKGNTMHMNERLPTLTSYEAAVNHYNSVVPLRSGSMQGKRPLGAVRRYIRSIIRLDGNPDLNPSAGNTAGNADNTAGNPKPDVVLSYYQNDVIRFKPDNRVIVNTCGWPSISTYGFLADTLNGWLKFNRARGRIYYVQTGIGSHLLPMDGKSGVTIDLSTGEAIGGGDIDTYEVNLTGMHTVRRGFKEFVTYAHNCIAMKTPVTVARQRASAGAEHLYVTARTLAGHNWNNRFSTHTPAPKPQKELRAAVLALATRDAGHTEEQTLERYYEAFNRLAASAIVTSPIARYTQGTEFSATCDRKTFDAFFTNVLKLSYADTAFDLVRHESPMRKLPSDRNQFFLTAKDY
jgi:hypothetical protein